MQVESPDFYVCLGRILQRQRRAEGLSRRVLAERMDSPLRASACYQYERAIARPSISWLCEWSNVMGLTIEQIITAVERELSSVSQSPDSVALTAG